MEPESSDKPEFAINALPPAVIALTLLILGIEVVMQLANAGILGGARGVGWRIAAVEEYGFSTVVMDRVLVSGDYSFDMLKRFVTYPFINMQLTQVAFCAALTLALGKFTGEFYGGWKVLVIYFVTTISGAVIFGLLVEGRYALVGGFTPVYGLIGAYTYALWLRLGQAGENQIKAFRLIGFLLGLQLLFGLLFGTGNQWVAELGGFSTGFMLSIVLAPGGWTTLLARMRQRS
jgi:membrane associated rhomboid family serine protease